MGLLLHTVVGVMAIAPLVWYFVRHWDGYADQALSDVLLLGYVGLALWRSAYCRAAGDRQALLGIRTSPWLRYSHLISTFCDSGGLCSSHLDRMVAASQE